MPSRFNYLFLTCNQLDCVNLHSLINTIWTVMRNNSRYEIEHSPLQPINETAMGSLLLGLPKYVEASDLNFNDIAASFHSICTDVKHNVFHCCFLFILFLKGLALTKEIKILRNKIYSPSCRSNSFKINAVICFHGEENYFGRILHKVQFIHHSWKKDKV